MVYGRQTEVGKRTICNNNLHRTNQGVNLPFWGRVGVDSNTPRVLGEHLPRRAATVALGSFLSKVIGIVRKKEGRRAAQHGRRHFWQ